MAMPDPARMLLEVSLWGERCVAPQCLRKPNLDLLSHPKGSDVHRTGQLQQSGACIGTTESPVAKGEHLQQEARHVPRPSFRQNAQAPDTRHQVQPSASNGFSSVSGIMAASSPATAIRSKAWSQPARTPRTGARTMTPFSTRSSSSPPRPHSLITEAGMRTPFELPIDTRLTLIATTSRTYVLCNHFLDSFKSDETHATPPPTSTTSRCKRSSQAVVPGTDSVTYRRACPHRHGRRSWQTRHRGTSAAVRRSGARSCRRLPTVA